MAPKSFLWLKKTSAIFTLLLLVAGLSIQSSMADNILPYVTMATATPATFNASNNEYVSINYQLSGIGANVIVEITDANMAVKKTFVNAPNMSPGLNTVTWYGKDENTGVAYPTGIYYYFVKTSPATNVISGTFQLTSTTNPNGAPVVTSLSAPTTLNTSNAEMAAITYYLDRAASSVEVQIVDANGVIRRMLPGTTVANQANTVTWDGRGDNGQYDIIDTNNIYLPNGTYTIIVKARDSYGNIGTNSRTIALTGTGSTYGMVNITNVTVSPSSINQNNHEIATITYYLDRQATSAYVEIFDQNNNRKRYIPNTSIYVNQSNPVIWNGYDDDGNILPGGVYTVVVNAINTYGTAKNNSARITLTSNNNNTCGYLNAYTPVLSNVYAQPNSINYGSGNQSTTIYYSVDRIANVTIDVLDGNNNVLKKLANDICINGLNSVNTVTWDGRDTSGNTVPNGNYPVRVRARTLQSNEAIKYTYVQVNGYTGGGVGGTNTGTIIRDIMVSPEVFNPRRGQVSTVYYNLTQNANVTVDILDRNGNFIKTIVSSVSRYSSNYNYTNTFGRYNYADVWNGTDANGYTNDNLYQFRVRAVGTNNSVTDTQTAWVEVDTDGNIIGFPNGQNCSGYRDVSINNPSCKALQALNVIQGYSDGTARLYQLINRAETAAVIARYFDIQEDTAGYMPLNFTDASNDTWYSGFARALIRIGVIRGYPDRTLRLTQTVKRVELAKIFAETASYSGVQLMTSCSSRPYIDTLLNVWYSDDVCTMKRWNLMSDDGTGQFNGTSSSTRADVLDLLYRYEKSGLSQGVNNYNANYNYYNSYSYTPYNYNASMYYTPVNATTYRPALNSTTYYTPTTYGTNNYYQDYVQY